MRKPYTARELANFDLFIISKLSEEDVPEELRPRFAAARDAALVLSEFESELLKLAEEEEPSDEVEDTYDFITSETSYLRDFQPLRYDPDEVDDDR